ncbi:hypothetical protein DUI87_11812 [Hirundo rustica rustica]|uniref:Uncharacterized protein n=1 Tax=Hirundo rustica rustica TaxID=333673 RepID=A0A3M0KL64_HIRRU|nr:hypothetical protein DUI87_11812 [Hirundo rustica rustica]
MGTMEMGFSLLERPRGPAIVVPEQDTSVFVGGARLSALGGDCQLVCSLRARNTLVLLWICASGTGNGACIPPAHLAFGCNPNSAQEAAFE